jgi:hypothetical protein
MYLISFCPSINSIGLSSANFSASKVNMFVVIKYPLPLAKWSATAP